MFTVLYILVCLLWGVFSVGMQKKLYPQKSASLDLILNFVVNSLTCPISMSLAAYCLFTDRAWGARIR